MARLVGMPCAIASRLMLEGLPALKTPGVLAPYTPATADPIRAELAREGIALREEYI